MHGVQPHKPVKYIQPRAQIKITGGNRFVEEWEQEASRMNLVGIKQ